MKNKIKKDENISYKIIQIKTNKISIAEPDDIHFDKITITGRVNFEVNGIDEDTAIIIFDIVTDFFDPKNKEILISHVGRTKYNVQQLPLSKDKERFNFPDQLMIMLYSMAHSHARALLAHDLQNTVYKDKVFLPIIDPSLILNNEVINT